MLEFQWFLIVLSVLPSRILAMSAHLFAWSRFSKNRIHSSSSVQLACLLIIGLRWLCHLSLHCLPILPGKLFAICVHCLAPYLFTKLSKILSSKSVHGPLIRSGLSTFCHLCKHYTSVLSTKLSAIFFQFLPPLAKTALVRISSSFWVQWPLILTLGPVVVYCFWYLVGPLL